jgi:hypothetical protein
VVRRQNQISTITQDQIKKEPVRFVQLKIEVLIILMSFKMERDIYWSAIISKGVTNINQCVVVVSLYVFLHMISCCGEVLFVGKCASKSRI